jgi:hypothetical protein
MEVNTHTSTTVKTASTIAMLAGIWLFLSPWVYTAYRLPQAWNSWVVGFFIALFAAIRIASPWEDSAWLSWLNCLLGIWTFASPWVYNYIGDTHRFINSLCVGVIVFIVAMRSATASPHTGSPLHTGA